MTEEQEQISLMQQAAYHPICKKYLFAIPNGGKRHIVTALKLKAQGVKPGVPDILLAYPSGRYHGLFIELKRRAQTKEQGGSRSKGTLTADQMIVMRYLNDVNYLAQVAYGADEAWEIITKYLEVK